MADQPASPRRWARRLRRGLRNALLLAVAIALAVAFYLWWTAPVPMPPTPIFQGVTYQCVRLPDTEQSGGLMHLVEVNLSAPGIELYITPEDPQALAANYEYRLQYIGTAMSQAKLSVAVNGATFQEKSGWLPLPGDFAWGGETIVSDGVVNHVHQHSYLMWFEDDLTPHMQVTKPPHPEALARARWAIAGQEVLVRDGQVRQGTSTHPDLRTGLGIDPENKRLWIAAFEKASYQVAGEQFVKAGAKFAIMLDGGSSTAFAIGPGAKHVSPGVKLRHWRPVATFFGIRAKPLEP